VHQLLKNLTDAEEAADAVALFLDTFARSMPTGHQNSFAHRTLPSAVVVALRTDQPINLVSAFERPVFAGRSGIIEESAGRLATEFTAVATNWGNAPVLTIATYATGDEGTDKLVDAFGPSMPFPHVTDRVRDTVAGWLADGEVR
jgi:CRISPR system Cascade subunit CasC